MKSLSYFGLLAILILACGPSKNPNDNNATAAEELANKTPTLREVWSSDTTLRTPESVLLDRQRNLIYVANVNMNPWEKDGNGFISRMDLQGKVIDLKWVEGLSGPKGMAVDGSTLYVADIDDLVAINVETGVILKKWSVPDNPTLNDISVIDGVVYISGSDSQKIFQLKDDQVTIFLEGDLGRPNGLYAEKGRLLMLTSGSSQLESIDWQTKDRTTLVGDLGHGDGVVPAGDGAYLASSWRGALFFIDKEGKSYTLLDTEADKINAADIDYSIEKNLLLVPTFFDNRVVAYEVH